MTGPLVLNCRPEGQLADLSRLLREHGLTPLEVPLTRTETILDAEALRSAADAVTARRVDWVVFSSATAVRCLFESAAASGIDIRAALLSCRVLCGPATADEVRRQGLGSREVLQPFSAAGARDFLLRTAPGPVGVLLPRAEGGREELMDGLAAAGIPVVALAVYRVLPIRPATLESLVHAVRRGQLAAIALTSPSSLQSLLNGLRSLGEDPSDLLQTMPLTCIGSTTAAAVRAAGLRVAAIAPETRLESLAETTAAYLASISGEVPA